MTLNNNASGEQGTTGLLNQLLAERSVLTRELELAQADRAALQSRVCELEAQLNVHGGSQHRPTVLTDDWDKLRGLAETFDGLNTNYAENLGTEQARAVVATRVFDAAACSTATFQGLVAGMTTQMERFDSLNDIMETQVLPSHHQVMQQLTEMVETLMLQLQHSTAYCPHPQQQQQQQQQSRVLQQPNMQSSDSRQSRARLVPTQLKRTLFLPTLQTIPELPELPASELQRLQDVCDRIRIVNNHLGLHLHVVKNPSSACSRSAAPASTPASTAPAPGPTLSTADVVAGLEEQMKRCEQLCDAVNAQGKRAMVQSNLAQVTRKNTVTKKMRPSHYPRNSDDFLARRVIDISALAC